MAADRVRDSWTLQLVRNTGLSGAPFHASLPSALKSDWAERLIDIAFVSRSFDGFMTRLSASDALLWLADEAAQSPPARAALSRRFLGVADQRVGSVEHHSCQADDRLQRAGRRLARRRTDATAPDTGAPAP